MKTICTQHNRNMLYRWMSTTMDLSRNMLWYTCLIKHAETLLRTKDWCTHSLLHAQQDALTQYKDVVQNFTYTMWHNTHTGETEFLKPWKMFNLFL
jgi:hypothetical protein